MTWDQQQTVGSPIIGSMTLFSQNSDPSSSNATSFVKASVPNKSAHWNSGCIKHPDLLVAYVSQAQATFG